VAGELPRPPPLEKPPAYDEGVAGGLAGIWIPTPRFGRQGTFGDKGFQDLAAVGLVVIAVIIVYSGAAAHPVMLVITIVLVAAAVGLVLDPPDEDPTGSRLLMALYSSFPSDLCPAYGQSYIGNEGLSECMNRMGALVDEYVIASEQVQGVESVASNPSLRLNLADRCFRARMAVDGMAHVVAFELARSDLFDNVRHEQLPATLDSRLIHRADAMRATDALGLASADTASARIADPIFRFGFRAALRELDRLDVMRDVHAAGFAGGVAALQGAVTWIR
jgi:hypothetical protein